MRAPAEVVYRWLCQLRVAPYSYDWIDNRGRRSPRELTPGLEQLAEGQTVMIFRLVSFAWGRHLTLVTPQGGTGVSLRSPTPATSEGETAHGHHRATG